MTTVPAKKLAGVLVLIVVLFVAGYLPRQAGGDNSAAPKQKSAAGSTVYALKDVFKNDFLIGTAMTPSLDGNYGKIQKLIIRQFNCISPETLLKWEPVHPRLGEYTFRLADAYVDFARKHGMKAIGHVLVWHKRTPDWVFEDDKGKPVTRKILLERMREHIHTVVGRYKGRIMGWDVVNEAIKNDGSLRDSPWRRIIGGDFIEKAFVYTHQADPKAELYYNDFSMTNPKKRGRIVRLVKELKTKGIRIDGIGMQGHWGLDWPSIAEIEKSIIAYAGTGAKVMITELDINVLPSAWKHRGVNLRRSIKLRKELDPYYYGLPDDMQQKLAQRYVELFDLFRKHRDKITRVTFWGATDACSWLNHVPVKGRTNYPLLFDRDAKPKPAFRAVIKAASKQ